MSTMEKPFTKADAHEVVTRAGILLRTRPVPGSDPCQAEQWKKSVREFLESLVFQRALTEVGAAELGITPQDAPEKVLDTLDNALDSHEDNPIAVGLGVAIALGVAYYLGHQAGHDAAVVEEHTHAPTPPPVIVDAGGGG